MIIGIDIDLDTCKGEGYMMLEYDGRTKFDRTKDYRLFAYYPERLNLNNKLMLDTMYSFDELVEMYLEEKQTIDSYAETDVHVNFKQPSYRDLLNLASDLEAYFGI